jgi:hypothetical protein
MSLVSLRGRVTIARARRGSWLAGHLVVFTLIGLPLAFTASAQQPAAPATAPAAAPPGAPGDTPATKLRIVYLGKAYDEPIPLSLVDKVLTDAGLQGARLAIKDNNKTGRFLGQEFELVEDIVPANGDVAAKAKEVLAEGPALIVADLEAADLLALADLPEAKDALILDIRTNDDALRQEQCRANVFHLMPSWAMRADALAQYLMW